MSYRQMVKYARKIAERRNRYDDYEAGEEAGGEKRAEEIAKNLKKLGIFPEKIHAATNLPFEVIEKL
jgi:hypothetical protein